jgi:DNA-directed RNA polymerase subunit H (RpoH/RPB5)
MSSRRKSNARTILNAGIPLLTFVLGGSYALSVFMQTHVEVKDKHHKSVSTRKFDLEEEHKKLMSKLAIEDFKLSRIPRPEEVLAKQAGSQSSNTASKKIEGTK